MTTAVYSGSFNPLHKGHEAILRCIDADARFDRILLVVTPQNPFKENPGIDDALERLEDAREALRRHPDINASVSDIEIRMSPPQYTIRTLDTLKQNSPEDDFVLVIGADCLDSFPRWRDYQRILREYGVVVFPRKGYHRGHLRSRLMKEDPSYKIGLLKAPLVTISSTRIREGLSRGEDMSKWLM